MSAAHSMAEGNLAAKRFTRKAHGEFADVAARYADWSSTDEGVRVMMQLSFFAMARLSGQMARPAYRRAVRDLAITTTVPLRDLLLIAKSGLEVTRSALAGSGQIPFTPDEWDAEEETA